MFDMSIHRLWMAVLYSMSYLIFLWSMVVDCRHRHKAAYQRFSCDFLLLFSARKTVILLIINRQSGMVCVCGCVCNFRILLSLIEIGSFEKPEQKDPISRSFMELYSSNFNLKFQNATITLNKANKADGIGGWHVRIQI